MDPDSPEARAALEAKESRLWAGLGETGLWCPMCALPSGYTITLDRDPSRPSGTHIWRCGEDDTHRPGGD